MPKSGGHVFPDFTDAAVRGILAFPRRHRCPRTPIPNTPATLDCSVLHHEGGTDGIPFLAAVRCTVTAPCDFLGIHAGAEVTVMTSDRFDDGDRLVADLARGNPASGVPACGPGSVLRFTGCSMEASGDVEASGYVVLGAVPP